MPYDISERLRAARVQAVSRRKRVASVPVRQAAGAAAVFGNKASAILGGGGEGRTWWRALASVIP